MIKIKKEKEYISYLLSLKMTVINIRSIYQISFTLIHILQGVIICNIFITYHKVIFVIKINYHNYFILTER